MTKRKQDVDKLFEEDLRAGRQTREKGERPKSWTQPDLLPMPEDDPEWVFRWVRTSTYGQSDNRNVSMRFREGWEPVKSEDYPELQIVNDVSSEWGDKGCIEVGGLLLCKAPRKLMEERRAHYEKMAEQQMTAIDNNYMRESDPRMPVLSPERKSRVSFGGS